MLLCLKEIVLVERVVLVEITGKKMVLRTVSLDQKTNKETKWIIRRFSRRPATSNGLRFRYECKNP